MCELGPTLGPYLVCLGVHTLLPTHERRDSGRLLVGTPSIVYFTQCRLFYPKAKAGCPHGSYWYAFSNSLPSKDLNLTILSGLLCVCGQHDTSLPDRKKHARGLFTIRLRYQRPLLKNLRYLDHHLCYYPSLRCIQHIQPPALPARNLRLCCRMGSFHERVAVFQDGGVGQGSGRANCHFDRKFGLDV